MNKEIESVFQAAFEGGSPMVPPGRTVMDLLRWDDDLAYHDALGEHTYFWYLHLSLVGVGDDILKLRQVLLLKPGSMPSARKHESTIAFRAEDISALERAEFRPNHPGEQMEIPDMFGGSVVLDSPGVPAGIAIRFARPIMVRRYVEFPLVYDAQEREFAIFDYIIWFAEASTRQVALDHLTRWWQSARDVERAAPAPLLPTPEYNEFPKTPPGSIDRS